MVSETKCDYYHVCVINMNVFCVHSYLKRFDSIY